MSLFMSFLVGKLTAQRLWRKPFLSPLPSDQANHPWIQHCSSMSDIKAGFLFHSSQWIRLSRRTKKDITWATFSLQRSTLSTFFPGLTQLGLSLYVSSPAARLPTVTTISVPRGIDWKAVVDFAMKEWVRIASFLSPMIILSVRKVTFLGSPSLTGVGGTTLFSGWGGGGGLFNVGQQEKKLTPPHPRVHVTLCFSQVHANVDYANCTETVCAMQNTVPATLDDVSCYVTFFTEGERKVAGLSSNRDFTVQQVNPGSLYQSFES